MFAVASICSKLYACEVGVKFPHLIIPEMLVTFLKKENSLS